jgi:hypothetical protein
MIKTITNECNKYKIENDFVEHIKKSKVLEDTFKNQQIIEIKYEYTLNDTSKRVDCVVICKDCVFICEFKLHLKTHYISQLMTYDLLAKKEFTDKKVYTLLIACYECSFEETSLLLDYLISYNLNGFGVILYENKRAYIKEISLNETSLNNIKDLLIVKNETNYIQSTFKYGKYVLNEDRKIIENYYKITMIIIMINIMINIIKIIIKIITKIIIKIIIRKFIKTFIKQFTKIY